MKTLLAFLTISAWFLTNQQAPAEAAGPAPSKPNIVLIVVDDLGYADAGFNGSMDIRTPHIDMLAKGGAILSSFYVQTSCSPTRAALMTGRYAMSTGVYMVVRPQAPWGLNLEEQTMAEMLRAAGYETAITGKWHLGEFEPAYRPTRRGFDHQYGQWFGSINHFTHERQGVHDWHRNDKPNPEKGYTTHLIAKEARRRILEKTPDKPLFLYVPFFAVHTPLQVPASYTEPYAGLPRQRKLYAGMMAATDEAVGQIIAALEEKGIRENTLIIFTADNGGFQPGIIGNNGPHRGGKGGIYEGGIRACAFANWPGRIPAGITIDEPFHAIDWYPTLAKLTASPLEQKLPLDGRDIWPVLTERAKSPHEFITVPGTRRGDLAIRKGDWKLIVTVSPENDVMKEELYNLAADLGESRDLAAEQPEKRAELRAIYDRTMATAVPTAEKPGGLADG